MSSRIRNIEAKFPDANTRSRYLSNLYDRETPEFQIAFDSMYWILGEFQAYSVKQYSLRDAAVVEIKAGNIDLALTLLAQIGE